MSITVSFPWKVHAKQRPRSTKGGHTYTPKATKAAEKIVADNFRQAVGEGFAPLDGPLDVKVYLSDTEVGLEITQRDEHTQKKLRGDIDNYLKTILDALNGVAYIDDRQIVSLTGVKL